MENLADFVTDWVGSIASVLAHTILFLYWYDAHVDMNVLTLIVSLEAIYLCIFLQMSSNQHGERDRKRALEDHLKLDAIIEQLEQINAPAVRRNGKKTIRRS